MANDYRRTLIQRYFPEEEWERAYRVMMGESGGRSDAVGDDYPIRGVHAASVGLFQIRTLPGRPSAEQLKDPEFNVRYAANMQREQGWKPWTVARNLGYTNGGSKQVSSYTSNKSMNGLFTEKARRFREDARKRGWPEDKIDAYIDQKAQLELGKRGDISPEDIEDYSTRMEVTEAIGDKAVVDEGLEETITAVQEGMSIKDIPIADRAGVVAEMKERGIEYETEEERKSRIKTAGEYKKVEASVGNILAEFNRIPTTQKGPIAGKLAKHAPFGMAAQATEYEEARKGFAGTLKYVVGEVGRLTDWDIERIMGILPTVTDTPEQAAIAEERIRNILFETYGEELTGKREERPGEGMFKEGEEERPLISEEPKSRLSIEEGAKTLIPALRLLEPVETINKIADSFPRTKKLLQTRQEEITKDPETWKKQAVQTMFPALQLTTPEGRGAGLELGLLIFGPAVMKRGVKAAGKIIRPFKTAGEFRAAKIAQAEGKTISGDKVLKTIKKATSGTKISATKRKAVDRFIAIQEESIAGKQISVDDAVRLISDANDAFTQAGKVGKGATAKFNKELGDALRSELAIVASDVARANRIFTILYRAQKLTGKVGRAVPYVLGGELIRRGLTAGTGSQRR